MNLRRKRSLKDQEKRRIVPEEVKNAIGKMENGKATGKDMFPLEIFKRSGERGVLWITEAMNKCWNEERTHRSGANQ